MSDEHETHGDPYDAIPHVAAQRHSELAPMLAPIVELTDTYGRLISRLVVLLGQRSPASPHEVTLRDLVADTFDFLYAWRRPLLEGSPHIAHPIGRRAFESLSLLAATSQDPSLGDRWEAGQHIENAAIRKALSRAPMAEDAPSLDELHEFLDLGSHPNRLFVNQRFLGDGNEYVLGPIGRPSLTLILDHLDRLVACWFWFGAVTCYRWRELLKECDPGYGKAYSAAAKQVPELRSWIRENIIHTAQEERATIATERVAREEQVSNQRAKSPDGTAPTAATTSPTATPNGAERRQPSMDVRAWAPADREYHAQMQAALEKAEHSNLFTDARHLILDVDAASVYSLLKVHISPRPNGIYTLLRDGKPLDNIVWWDFVLSYDQTILHVIRTAHVLEARVHDPDPANLDFDPGEFLRHNLSALRPVVDAQLDECERHSIYLNHYESYRHCVEELWDELTALQLEPPRPPASHATSRAAADEYTTREKAFVSGSRRFHVLGKSLILHSAFMAEACLNTVFRIGAVPALRSSEAAIKQLLRANFQEKLKLLSECTVTFKETPNLKDPAVKAALELMELRNKYVHADQSSRHNKVGETRFDDDFPLHPVSGFAPGVDFALRAYHYPSREQLQKAYEAGHRFCRYLLELVDAPYRSVMDQFLEQEVLGFNHTKGVYSIVYTYHPFSFFVFADEGSKGTAEDAGRTNDPSQG
jgi:hypothetical protein